MLTDLTKRLDNLTDEDFFKKGYEVKKDGTILAKTNANENSSDYVKVTEGTDKYKELKAIVNKLKADEPNIYEGITEIDNTKCDIRPFKRNDKLKAKNAKLYGIFPDESNKLESVYLTTDEDKDGTKN